VDLANYCAWFAPLEKVYFNGRYNHHRPELPNYMTVRAGLELIRVNEDERPKPKLQELAEVFRTIGAEYVVVHAGPGDSGPSRRRAKVAMERQWTDADHWSPWYLDGRSAVCGWRPRPGAEKPTFAALRVEPLVLAFGPGVEPLKGHTVRPVPAVGGWEDSFVRSPGISPAGADEAFGWGDYKRVGLIKLAQKQETIAFAFYVVDRTVGGVGVAFSAFPRLQSDDSSRAIAFLALRAARRAIEADPNHPDGYLALAQALADPDLPMPISEDERTLGQLTALRQCLARMPPPQQFRTGVYAASPSRVAWLVARMYLNPRQEYGQTLHGVSLNIPAFRILVPVRERGFPQNSGYLRAGALFYVTGDNRVGRKWVGDMAGPGLGGQALPGGPYLLPLDLAKEYLELSEKYQQEEFRDTPEVRSDPDVMGLKEDVKGASEFVGRELRQANDRYENEKPRLAGRGPSLLAAQVELALKHNLVGEALRLLGRPDTLIRQRRGGERGPPDPDVEFVREFPQHPLEAALTRVALQLALGRLEDGAADLDALAAEPEVQRVLAEERFRPPSRMLAYTKHLLEGNYGGAGEVVEGLDGRAVGLDPGKPLRDAFDPAFYVKTADKLEAWVRGAPYSLFLSPTAFDLAIRMGAPAVALEGYDQHPGFLVLQNDLQATRRRDADFYARRGLLSLYEGDIPNAKRRFLQTRQPAVKDWGLPEFRHPTAELYLTMIEEAERRSAAK
jgi:hypothetical protein